LVGAVDVGVEVVAGEDAVVTGGVEGGEGVTVTGTEADVVGEERPHPAATSAVTATSAVSARRASRDRRRGLSRP
jgi:hypothetical protein